MADDGSRHPWRLMTSGNRNVWVLLDLKDLVWARKHKWFLNDSGYVFRNVGKDKIVYMHRDVTNLEEGDGMVADHINGNRTDNRRSNLRVVTVAENNQNMASKGGDSKHRGVSWDKTKQKWVAYGHKTVEGKSKTFYIGAFDTEEEAALAASKWREENLSHTVEDRHRNP